MSKSKQLIKFRSSNIIYKKVDPRRYNHYIYIHAAIKMKLSQKTAKIHIAGKSIRKPHVRNKNIANSLLVKLSTKFNLCHHL